MIALGVFALGLSLSAFQAPKIVADPDLKEMSTYTLTMETVQKVVRVNQTLFETLKQDPRVAEELKLKQELAALEKKDERSEAEDKRRDEIQARLEVLDSAENSPVNLNDAKNLNEMAAKIGAYPPMAAALRKEGMTPRDYAKFLMAALQAGMAAGFQKAGLLKETPEGVNPANIKFVLEHEAELKKLQQIGGGEIK